MVIGEEGDLLWGGVRVVKVSGGRDGGEVGDKMNGEKVGRVMGGERKY